MAQNGCRPSPRWELHIDVGEDGFPSHHCIVPLASGRRETCYIEVRNELNSCFLAHRGWVSPAGRRRLSRWLRCPSDDDATSPLGLRAISMATRWRGRVSHHPARGVPASGGMKFDQRVLYGCTVGFNMNLKHVPYACTVGFHMSLNQTCTV